MASLSKCVCVAGLLGARVPISRSRGEGFASRELKGDDELVVSWEWSITQDALERVVGSRSADFILASREARAHRP